MALRPETLLSLSLYQPPSVYLSVGLCANLHVVYVLVVYMCAYIHLCIAYICLGTSQHQSASWPSLGGIKVFLICP